MRHIGMSLVRFLMMRGSMIALLCLAAGLSAKVYSQSGGYVRDEVLQDRISSLAIALGQQRQDVDNLVAAMHRRDIENERRMTALETALDGQSKLLWGIAGAIGINLLMNILERLTMKRSRRESNG